MRYLADTDWIIHALHGNRAIIRRLDELAAEGIGISVISVAELYQGVFYSNDPHGNELLLLEFLSGYDILPIDDEICRHFARERGRLKTAGTPIADLDLLHRLRRPPARPHPPEQQPPPLRTTPKPKHHLHITPSPLTPNHHTTYAIHQFPNTQPRPTVIPA